MENLQETEETGLELDMLLQKAVDRGEALKMPKPKLHWKQALQKRQEFHRKHYARASTKRYRKRYHGSLRYKYGHLRRQMAVQGVAWELELSDWLLAWAMARPAVKGGIPIAAWKATGKRDGAVHF